MEPLTPDHVQAALDASGTGIQVRYFDQPTATAPEAAATLQTSLGSIVKSLVFMVEDQPIVVLTAGDQKVDDRKLAEHHGVGRKRVKIATPEQCIAIVGYAPGGVPPLGHRSPNLTVYIDESLRRFETLYAAAGAANTIFPVSLEQLLAMTGGVLMDVVKETTA